MDMLEEILKLKDCLYHIHSLGNLLGSYYFESLDAERIKKDPDEISNPFLSISDMISEKVESCLKITDTMEEHTFESIRIPSRVCENNQSNIT